MNWVELPYIFHMDERSSFIRGIYVSGVNIAIVGEKAHQNFMVGLLQAITWSVGHQARVVCSQKK